MSQDAGKTTNNMAEAVGRTSTSSTRGSLEKTISNTSTEQNRRRSSVGLFNNLEQYKRGTENYDQRRASHADQMPSSGILGGWFNSTFRGMPKPE